MALVENLDDFLVDGIEARFGEAFIMVNFRSDYIEFAGISGHFPIATAKDDDLTGVSEGAPVVIDSVNYTVVIIQKQEYPGLSDVILEKL